MQKQHPLCHGAWVGGVWQKELPMQWPHCGLWCPEVSQRGWQVWPPPPPPACAPPPPLEVEDEVSGPVHSACLCLHIAAPTPTGPSCSSCFLPPRHMGSQRCRAGHQQQFAGPALDAQHRQPCHSWFLGLWATDLTHHSQETWGRPWRDTQAYDSLG